MHNICKRLLAMGLAVLMLISAASVLAEDDLLARIQKRGSIVIATEGNWSPWTYHDKDDELVGLDIEIGKLIAEGLGVKAEFKETDFNSIFGGIDSGRFDIACNGVGYTPERAEKYNFSTPYVYTPKVLVVRSDNEDIHTLADLKGRTTANSPNSTYANLAEENGATVTSIDTLDQTIELLLQGRVDATINAKGSVEEYLEEHPNANIKIVETLPGDPVCVPIRKGDDSASLVAAINEILAAAREDGTLAALSEKYFHMDLTKAQ